MSKVLTAYFSATGVTAEVAKRLSERGGFDLHEIVPQYTYTMPDLDWTNKRSRSTLEMEDLSARPKIKGKIDNFDDYSVIFLGFPIWWYREPSIIDTFLEQYDFSGKTIVLFATSGSSGFGKTASRIKKLTGGSATVIEGRILNNSPSDEELSAWIKSLNI